MFDFWKFYKGLLSNRTNNFDKYWAKFPTGTQSFRKELSVLLEEAIANKDSVQLSNVIALIYWDGGDKSYTDTLLLLLDEKWHISEEDIVGVLEEIKDPKSIEKLYETAVNIPDYDDMRALAKKCMWALSAINTPESVEKLQLLQNLNDEIISENATFQLQNVVNKI